MTHIFRILLVLIMASNVMEKESMYISRQTIQYCSPYLQIALKFVCLSSTIPWQTSHTRSANWAFTSFGLFSRGHVTSDALNFMHISVEKTYLFYVRNFQHLLHLTFAEAASEACERSTISRKVENIPSCGCTWIFTFLYKVFELNANNSHKKYNEALVLCIDFLDSGSKHFQHFQRSLFAYFSAIDRYCAHVSNVNFECHNTVYFKLYKKLYDDSMSGIFCHIRSILTQAEVHDSGYSTEEKRSNYRWIDKDHDTIYIEESLLYFYTTIQCRVVAVVLTVCSLDPKSLTPVILPKRRDRILDEQ